MAKFYLLLDSYQFDNRKQIFYTKVFLLAIIVFSNLWNTVYARKIDIEFEHLSLRNGLSQSSVTCILHDSKGFMWFGTLDGLNRHDGYKFNIFRHNPENKYSLADNAITSLFEDKENKLWVGTQSMGLCLYNRILNRFENFKYRQNDDKSLSNNTVVSMFQDKAGTIWIGTASGLNRLEYSAKGVTFSRFYNNLQITDKAAKTNGMNTEESGFSCNHINFIAQQDEHSLWIATDAGLYMFNTKTLKFKLFETVISNGTQSRSLRHEQVYTLLTDLFGDLWIGSESGLLKYVHSSRELIPYIAEKNGIDNLKVTSIIEDYSDTEKESYIWIGTEKAGLFKLIRSKQKGNELEGENFIRYFHDAANPHSLSTNNILSLYISSNHVLWVGTSLGGINKWDKNSEVIENYQHNPFDPYSLSSNQVRSFYEDRNGTIWVGTVEGGLNSWDKYTDKFTSFQYNASDATTLHNNHVRSILEDSNGNLWIGTDGGGLDKFDRKTNKVLEHFGQASISSPVLLNKTLSNNRVWKIYEDSSHKLWIATFGGGLNCYDPETGSFSYFLSDASNPNSLSDNYVTSIIEDRTGKIWVGTFGGGLSAIDMTNKAVPRFKRYINDEKNPESIGNNRIYTLFLDSKGNLWIGTKESLNRYYPDGDKFERFTVRNGLCNDVVMGILEDEIGNLWISTNGGISKFNPTSKTFRNYDVNDGLQSNEFLVGAAYKTTDGKMLFGGINGFNAFYPLRIVDNPYPPDIVITGFSIYNQNADLDSAISEKKVIDLQYFENYLTFEFVALNYISPSKNQYAFKMEGLDKDWNYVVNRRFATYANIEPGEYVFKVKGSNNDGIWNEKGVQIVIRIEPPFWKTVWFNALLVIIIMIIIAIFIHIRERNLTLDKIRLEHLVEERTKVIRRQKEKITDSIQYARRIQNALLPTDQYFNNLLPQHFVLFKPRNIVSGDYYWLNKKNDKIIIAIADCTGHGVPGAFMSLLGISFLNEIINKSETLHPSDILNELREKVMTSLKQNEENAQVNDGMDMALLIIETDSKTLRFAGANNPVFIYRADANGEELPQLIQLKPDRMPIGVHRRINQGFTTQEFQLQDGDTIYAFSDGYFDQFGGDKNKKYSLVKFKELLNEIYYRPLDEQLTILDHSIEEWKGNYEQVDDMLIVGLRI